MPNERTHQQSLAYATQERVQRFHYLCLDGTFSAVAPSEAGAFRVLNAERPGVLGLFTGATDVPAPPLAQRIVHCVHCRNGYVTTIGSTLCGKCREESAANRQVLQ